MALLLGTEDGVYRAPTVQFDDATRVLATDRVLRVRRFDAVDGAFACTESGLYYSTDGGTAWTDLGLPRDEVYSVCVSPGGDRWYVGTHPAHVYVSTDGGDAWRELDGFQELPSRDTWHTPRHRNEAHVRRLDCHPDAPDRVIAGVEVGGVHVSDDRGETWSERRAGVHDDVHHVLVQSAESAVASCGDGLYRTRDAGRSWTRLDGNLDQRYFREALAHDGRLYAAAAAGPPNTWASGADAGLFVSEDDGDSVEAASYPGGPEEVVLAWSVADGRVIGATNAGRVIRETDADWATVGQVEVQVRSLCVV